MDWGLKGKGRSEWDRGSVAFFRSPEANGSEMRSEHTVCITVVILLYDIARKILNLHHLDLSRLSLVFHTYSVNSLSRFHT